MNSNEPPSTVGAPAVFEDLRRLFYDDRLGRGACLNTSQCQASTRNFRVIASRARKVGTRFYPCTPSEMLIVPPEVQRQGLFAAAVFDLDAYPDFTAVMEAARTVSEKRGRVNREIARARRLGYYAKAFAVADHAEDVVAIHQSKTVRDGRTVESEHYRRTAEELRAGPQAIAERCPEHHHFDWGVFRRVEGHMQGGRQTDEQLVAYLRLGRTGECAWYNTIMGHGDHLRGGVMYLLHYDLVAAMLGARPPGLRYLAYYTFARRPDDPASLWKYLALFKPYCLHYLDDRELELPVDPPMPHLAEGLLTLKHTVATPWAQALAFAGSLGIGEAWLQVLHRIQVVEAAHSPGLAARLLRAGSFPPLDVLRPLASGLFPSAALQGVVRATAVLRGGGRGLDTLLPLHDRRIEVRVFHANAAELDALKATYPASWAYQVTEGPALAQALPEDGLIVVEPSTLGELGKLPEAFHGRIIIAAGEALLTALGCTFTTPAAGLAARFGAAMAAPLMCHGNFFRHGHPDDHAWMWFERA